MPADLNGGTVIRISSDKAIWVPFGVDPLVYLDQQLTQASEKIERLEGKLRECREDPRAW